MHSAVVDNDIESLVAKTLPPAPVMLLTSKDANGLTPLHKVIFTLTFQQNSN